MRAGEAFVSQHSKWIHFGLGEQPEIKRITCALARPYGIRGVFWHRAKRALSHRSRKCSGANRGGAAKLRLEPGEQKPHAPTQKSRSLLVFRKHLPTLPLDDIDGRRMPFDPKGKITLVNLWASWCQPCMVELGDLAEHYESLRAEGIEVVAVSVDGLGQDPGSRDAARSLAQKAAWPFPVRLATDQSIEQLTELDNATFYFQLPLPVPTSFLLDREGNVAAIYKGAVTSEQVMNDARLLDAPPEEFERAAAFFPGRDGLRYFQLHPLNFAAAYIEGEYFDDAKSHIEQFLAQRKQDDLRDPTANAAAGNRRSCVPTRCWWPSLDWQENDRTRLRLITNWNVFNRCLRRWLPAWLCFWPAKIECEEATRRVEALADAHADSAAVLDLAGSTYLRLGANRPAIESFRRAVELDETNVMFRFNLATALQAAGRPLRWKLTTSFSQNSRTWLRPLTTSPGS